MKTTQEEMTDKPGHDGTWPIAVIEGKESAACIGSGYCCKKTPCWESYRAIPELKEGPCPHLENDGERHWCGLITKASPQEAKRLRASLYVGAGCCSSLNDLRRDMLVRLHR